MNRPLIVNRGGYYEVRNATKLGYLIAGVGDCVDLNFPNSKTRRGRVQKGISQTIETSAILYVVVDE